MPNVSQAAASTKPRVSGSRVDDGKIPGASMPKTRAYVPPALREIPTVSPPRASDLPGVSECRVPNSAGIPDRPANVDALLRATRASLARAKRASKCLTIDKPDAQYGVNKFKWCATICREARLACRWCDQARETESHSPSPRAWKVIDEFCEGILQAFSSLFSRLVLAAQKPTAPKLNRFMLVDLLTAFLDMGKQGGIRECLWLEGFEKLKNIMSLTLDPQQCIKVLQEIVANYGDTRRFIRYHLYSYLYNAVYERYNIESKDAIDVTDWELIVTHLKQSISSSMRDDFLSLSKFFAPKSCEGHSTTVVDPLKLVTQILHAMQFAEGHYALAQAHEAAANISDPEMGYRELEKALHWYSEAHELLKAFDKENAGLAIAKIGLLRWRFYPKSDRPAAIQFLKSALKFEKNTDRGSWWLTQTKKHIAMYEEELIALKKERLRKEKEEQKRREQREKEERARAEELRCKAMFNNLETLKKKAEKIQVLDDLFTFSESLQRDFDPPESIARNQLRLHITNLKEGQNSRRICLKRIIRLYHPDKNGAQGDTWKVVCAEVTKVVSL
jgi:hypothetical protein